MTFLEIITPINLDEEKEKFLDSTIYNPQLKYNWDKKEIAKYLDKQYIYKKLLIKAFLTQNYKEINNSAQILFDTKIKKKFLKKAFSIIKEKPKKNNHNDIKSIIIEYKKAFAYFNLNYRVRLVDSIGFVARPKTSKKEVQIANNNIDKGYFENKASAAHELVHIIRYENGKFNKIEKDKNYLPTEEGLACYVQDNYPTFNNNSIFQHAAEYVLTEILLKKAFREGYNFLVKLGFSKDLAFSRAIRHKFGFMDTSIPGDIMKPAMYFYHSLKVSELSRDDKIKLFIGKISINNLKDYKSYKGKFSLDKIKKFFKL